MLFSVAVLRISPTTLYRDIQTVRAYGSAQTQNPHIGSGNLRIKRRGRAWQELREISSEEEDEFEAEEDVEDSKFGMMKTSHMMSSGRSSAGGDMHQFTKVR